MDGCVLVNNIDRTDRLQSIVIQDLRVLGLKLPKPKKLKKLNQSRCVSQDDLPKDKVFGESLSVIPGSFIPEYGYVPQFLIDAAKIIDANLDSEGIFRKSGAVSRQKELKVAIEDGRPFADANIFDVAVLIKQFFRELPEPLFVSHLTDVFVKCYQLPPDKDPKRALLRLCLLLPTENIGALRHLLHMLSRVAANAEKNKMTANNLAVVMAPNLMHGNKGGQMQKMNAAEEKLLNIKTCIVELLIRNCDQVGMVEVGFQNQLKLMAEYYPTDDELDASDDNMLEESKDIALKKKRRRSSSLSGLVNSIANKFRRSTDGKSINMSSASTFHGEMSLASNTSMDASRMLEESSANLTTPHIRKRRASGDTVPFSATKKKNILGNLPQRSALASTPFTPASAVKRPPTLDESSFLDVSRAPYLNSTTPVSGSKASRKKINLFSSPASSKRLKGQLVESRGLSPTPKGKRGFFGRLGGRSEKESHDSLGARLSLSGTSKPADRDVGITHSVSSPSLREEALAAGKSSSDSDLRESNGTHTISGASEAGVTRRSTGHSIPLERQSARRGLMSGAGSSGLKTDLLKHRKMVGRVSIGEPCPVIVPVVPDAIDIQADTELRRSRRDEYDLGMNKKGKGKNSKSTEDVELNGLNDLNKSGPSNMDTNLLDIIIPPPVGFGDGPAEEEKVQIIRDGNEDMEVNIESDEESLAGFSTISGGTVMRRTESGRYSALGVRSTSGSSIVSSVSDPGLAPSAVKGEGSERSQSSLDGANFCKPMALTAGSSHGHPSLKRATRFNESQPDDVYVTLTGVQSALEEEKRHQNVEGDYVVLRPHKRQTDKSGPGMRLLSDNYGSEESSSASSVPAIDQLKGDEENLSECKSLANIPDKINVHRKKSVSAEDLQTAPRVATPVRANSLHALSPAGKKFNYKPYLQISRDTHKLLARAGFMAPQADLAPLSTDVAVPVRSPKRSAHREEMKNTLRASFYEKRRSLSSSFRHSTRSSRSDVSQDTANRSSSASNMSQISSDWDGLSLDSHVFADESQLELQVEEQSEPTEIGHKVSEYSSKMEVSVLEQKSGDEVMQDDCQQDDVVGKGDEVKNDITDAATCENGNVPTVQANSSDEQSEGASATDDSVAEFKRPLTSRHGKLSESDKSMTLSGILDKSLAEHGPMRIKRAKIALQKHDSILDISERKAGSVAESVKHFSQPQPQSSSTRKAARHRRASSPVRIPTIFAKNEEKARQYREIASFARERSTSRSERASFSSNSPQDDSDPESEAYGSEGNITVMEVKGAASESSSDQGENSPDSDSISNDTEALNSEAHHKFQFQDRHQQSSKKKKLSALGSASSPSFQSPSKRQRIELSDSLMETINAVTTPESEKFLKAGDHLKSPLKSPLQESTNTADSMPSSPSASKSRDPEESVKPKSLAGHTPLRVQFAMDQASTSNPGHPQTLHPVKKAKNGMLSPRKNAPRSPRSQVRRSPRHSPRRSPRHSPRHPASQSQQDNGTGMSFSSVWLKLDGEEESNS
ncbi:uncharacterized protein LOC101862256 isoform X2 [Aplysia californica]|uniref:Uncharacterized protein LOC101862256 isoform X2 n=1 Tax=Aplysia californica TaxID=6500 RepID=A0ABM0JJY9_APLCA|nr:uncharacterized protein LOC101862256 isoform X2 [Aplysia californica]